MSTFQSRNAMYESIRLRCNHLKFPGQSDAALRKESFSSWMGSYIREFSGLSNSPSMSVGLRWFSSMTQRRSAWIFCC